MRRSRREFISLDEAESIAGRRLPRFAFDFIAGGAEDEVTLGANRASFRSLKLLTRTLRGVEERSQATTVLGSELDSPVVLAPTGLARLAGTEGDVAAARAARRCGTVHTMSSMSSHRVERVGECGGAASWFQLYLWRDQAVVDELVERAAASGCDTLVVTLDSPLAGKRERDLRNGFRIPPRLGIGTALDVLRRPRWLRGMYPPISFAHFSGERFVRPGETVSHARYINEILSNPGAGLELLERVRDRWSGPVAVKGVLDPGDAVRYADIGVDGIVVSNHGGRQLDGAPASIDALPAVADAVGDRVEVLVDGGVRRGTDVVKALALGARAVMIGRPWLWGLAAAGEDGVVRVIEILRDEIDRTLALLGCDSIDRLDRSILAPAGPGPGPAGSGPGAGEPR